MPRGEANAAFVSSSLPFRSEAQPGFNPLSLFPQIMIEFCPGGAVDATMLGECSSALCPGRCPLGISSLLARPQEQPSDTWQAWVPRLPFLSQDLAYFHILSRRCGRPGVVLELL